MYLEPSYVALILLFHCGTRVSFFETNIRNESPESIRKIEKVSKESSKDGICLEDESECKNDGQCCSKLCQLEAPHNSTKTDLMSFCVRKTKEQQCRNRACLHTHPSDPFVRLDMNQPQSCSNPRNMPSLYDECEINGGKIVANPNFAYCSCPLKERNKTNKEVGNSNETLHQNLSVLTSNQYFKQTTMEHVTMKFSTHIASKGPEILNVTGKNEIYVTENVDKKEDPDSLKALSEQEKHVKFSQLLGGLPHASRVVWDPEKYINIDYKEKDISSKPMKNRKSSFLGGEKKVEIRQKIDAVAEKTKEEKTKKKPTKENENSILSSERVEEEGKEKGNHFKSFVPKHFN